MKYKFDQVILHVGGDKTGSTAVQTVFDEERENFLQEGLIAYPPGRWHPEFGSYFCGEPENFIYNNLLGIKDKSEIEKRDKAYHLALVEWLENVPSCRCLVLSYEGFIGLEKAALRNIKKFLSQYAELIRVAIYVRPPLSYAVSAMSQRVKSGKNSFPLGSPPVSPYKKYISEFSKVFRREEILIRKFDRASLIENDVVVDFMSIANLPPELAFTFKNAGTLNEGLSFSAVKYGDFVIDSLRKHYLGKQISADLFYKRFGRYFFVIPGDGVRLTKAQLNEVLLVSRPHTKYLKSEFNLSFSEDESSYLVSEKERGVCNDEILSSIAEMNVLVALGESTRGNLVSSYDRMSVTKNTIAEIEVRLLNNSSVDWVSTEENPINMSYHLLDSRNNTVVFEGKRTPLPVSRVKAGEVIGLKVHIEAPRDPGCYKVVLLPVQEGHCWFDAKGFSPLMINMDVSGDDQNVTAGV